MRLGFGLPAFDEPGTTAAVALGAPVAPESAAALRRSEMVIGWPRPSSVRSSPGQSVQRRRLACREAVLPGGLLRHQLQFLGAGDVGAEHLHEHDRDDGDVQEEHDGERGGGAVAELVGLVPGQHGEGFHGFLAGADQHEGQVEHAQRVEHAEQHGHQEGGLDQREGDGAELAPPAGAVDPGGFVDFAGDDLHAGEDQEADERGGLPDFGDDDGELGGVAFGGPEDFGAEQVVGDAVGLEDPAPQQAGDGGGHGPRDQDAGAQEGPAAEGAVHGEGQAEAQDGLEEHRGDGEEGGVGEGVQEAPAGFADEEVGVVGQAHEGFDVGDEAVRVQAGFGAEQGLVHRGEQRVHNHQGQHQDGGGEQHRGHAAFTGGAFAASARAAAGWGVPVCAPAGGAVVVVMLGT